MSFLRNESNKEESTLFDISILDISEDVKIIKRLPISATLHDQFYKIENLPNLERHLNYLWVNPDKLTEQLLNKEKIYRALATLLDKVKRDYGTSVDGIICGVEDL